MCGPEVPDLPRDTPAPTGPPPTREADPVNSPDGRRRVVVTGLGAVTPVGKDARSTWRSAVAGESGIDFIRAFDASDGQSSFRQRLAQ